MFDWGCCSSRKHIFFFYSDRIPRHHAGLLNLRCFLVWGSWCFVSLLHLLHDTDRSDIFFWVTFKKKPVCFFYCREAKHRHMNLFLTKHQFSPAAAPVGSMQVCVSMYCQYREAQQTSVWRQGLFPGWWFWSISVEMLHKTLPLLLKASLDLKYYRRLVFSPAHTGSSGEKKQVFTFFFPVRIWSEFISQRRVISFWMN